MANMIRLPFLALTLSLLAACSEQEITRAEVRDINGLAYKFGETDPFTGIVKGNRVVSGILAPYFNCDSHYSEGKLDGLTTCFGKTGAKEFEVSFAAGKRQGTEKGWYPSGEVAYEINWQADLKHGVQRSYDEKTGKLVSESHAIAGQAEGRERRWEPGTDTLLTDLEWHNGKQTGFTIDQERELHFKNGELHGTTKAYSFEEGQRYLSRQEQWNEGKHVGTHTTWDIDGNVITEYIYNDDSVIQSRLFQKWEGQHVIEREMRVNVDQNPDADAASMPLDGLHKYCKPAYFCYEVIWSRGVPQSGTLELVDPETGKLLMSYTGTPSADGATLLKNGVERFHDGGLGPVMNVTWVNGVATEIKELRRTPEGLALVDSKDNSSAKPDFFRISGFPMPMHRYREAPFH